MTDEPIPFGGHEPEVWFRMVDRRNELLDTHRRETIGYAHRLSAWMIGQLFVANAGAIALVRDQGSPLSLSLFTLGIVSAMACGLSGWWQSHIVYQELVEMSGPEANLGPDYWKQTTPEQDDREQRWLKITIGSGVLSLFALAAGAATQIWI